MKTKLLLYCTKAKTVLQRDKTNGYCRIWQEKNNRLNCDYLNGKIVAECECDVEELINLGGQNIFETKTLDNFELLDKSCLYVEELEKYLVRDYEDAKGYALHLTNIKVFEKPLELSECCYQENCANCPHKIYCNAEWKCKRDLQKAPQNMMNVWYNGQKYFLISIRPEWICKILNGEKTIEVRRKILKGMM